MRARRDSRTNTSISVSIRSVRSARDLAIVGSLFREYRAWLAEHREVTAFDDAVLKVGLDHLDREIGGLPGDYRPPGVARPRFRGNNCRRLRRSPASGKRGCRDQTVVRAALVSGRRSRASPNPGGLTAGTLRRFLAGGPGYATHDVRRHRPLPEHGVCSHPVVLAAPGSGCVIFRVPFASGSFRKIRPSQVGPSWPVRHAAEKEIPFWGFVGVARGWRAATSKACRIIPSDTGPRGPLRSANLLSSPWSFRSARDHRATRARSESRFPMHLRRPGHSRANCTGRTGSCAPCSR